MVFHWFLASQLFFFFSKNFCGTPLFFMVFRCSKVIKLQKSCSFLKLMSSLRSRRDWFITEYSVKLFSRFGRFWFFSYNFSERPRRYLNWRRILIRWIRDLKGSVVIAGVIVGSTGIGDRGGLWKVTVEFFNFSEDEFFFQKCLKFAQQIQYL